MRTVDWFYAFTLAGILIVAIFSLYGLGELKRNLRCLLTTLTRVANQTKDDPPNGAAVALAMSLLILSANLAANPILDREYPTVAKIDVAALEKAAQDAWRDRNAVRAECAANELAAADPENGLAFHVRGLCFEESDRMEDALDQFNQAAERGYEPSIVRLQRYASP